MTKQDFINEVVYNRKHITRYKLNNMLDKYLKRELLKFQQWQSDEINDAYDEILIIEYLDQLKKL